jgi:hypothetical protein
MRNDVPISEQYRLAALDWVTQDATARLLEEGKTTYLAQRKAALGDMPDSKAEKLVKSSPDWADYIKKMVAAKTAANRQKVEVEFLRMRFMERNSEEATNRAERRM